MTDNRKKIPLAKLGRTRGLKGQMRVQMYNPDSELFTKGQVFHFTKKSGEVSHVTVAQSSGEWCDFKEIQNPEDARAHTNIELFLYRDEMPPLPKGNFYQVDLIDCEIIDHETKESIGILVDIIYTASNDVWVIKTKDGKEGEELMIPMMPEVMGQIDLDKKVISIHPPEFV